jgi:hypothetical protein
MTTKSVSMPKPDPNGVEVTPSGIEIAYWSLPKGKSWNRKTRWYEIRKGPKGKWREVPSVTTVLDVLKKGGLTWWGQKVGAQGVLTLFQLGALHLARTANGTQVLACAGPDGTMIVAGGEHVVELLKKCKLTVDDVRDAGGERGQNVHDAFEIWCQQGLMPEPSLYPKEQQGYVQALIRFIKDSGATAVANEVMVGSHRHGFAGRFDVLLEYPEVELVVHHTPVRGDQRAVLEAGIYLDDLKTSKDVYDAAFKQLEAYEEASIECGHAPTKGRGVIHVDAEGNYKRVPSPATFADYKAVLGVWKADQSLKKRKKESK